jgi:hypothetical protein
MGVKEDLEEIETTITECCAEALDIGAGVETITELSNMDMSMANIASLPTKLSDTVSKTTEMIASSDALNVKIEEMKAKVQKIIDSIPSCNCCGCCGCCGSTPKVAPEQEEGGGLPDVDAICSTMEEKRTAFSEAGMMNKLGAGKDLLDYTREAFPDLTQCVTETVKALKHLNDGIAEGKSNPASLASSAGGLLKSADLSVDGSAALKVLFTEVGVVMDDIKSNLPSAPSLF